MTEKLYEIHVKNHLDDRWVEWFQAKKIQHLENDITSIVVHVPDQPALHGLLDKIRDLNIELISIKELTNPRR